MRRFFRFLTNLDAQAWRAVAVSFVLFGGVGTVFLFGADRLGTPALPAATLADVWGRLARHAQDPDLVFSLMNEPYDIIDTVRLTEKATLLG